MNMTLMLLHFVSVLEAPALALKDVAPQPDPPPDSRVSHKTIIHKYNFKNRNPAVMRLSV